MARKTPWIGTSWKMNKTRAEAREFAKVIANSSVAATEDARLFVIPPFTAIREVADLLAPTSIRVGAQNMHWAQSGAWTGEVSAAMIVDAGATLVEIGHSERRTHFGETDQTVALKARAAIDNGLLALICVGDTRAEYDAGQTSDVLARQVRYALAPLRPDERAKILIAYEPVWSIGEGGVPADPDFADLQHCRIKDVSLRFFADPVAVVYGGSVNPDNCAALASQSNIDGLFIGRSAWEPLNFINIINIVASAIRG